MAKYIITLEDNALGVAITGTAVLTTAELLAGKKQTPAIALGDLLSQTAYGRASEWIRVVGRAADPSTPLRASINPVIH